MTNLAQEKTAQQYAAAHATHYTTKNLREAIDSYRAIIAEHPESAEAGYCWTQLSNIATSVLGKDGLIEAQVRSALAKLDHDGGATIAEAATDEGHLG